MFGTDDAWPLRTVAAEYVAAGGANGRRVIASAVARADEPAEILPYWAQEHGCRFPQPVKRGVADAVRTHYSEYAALKYDGRSRACRMGDVVDPTHPKPVEALQSDLFATCSTAVTTRSRLWSRRRC